MHAWSVVPGIALIAASFAIQFGTYLRRPGPLDVVLFAVRLRFVGFGVLFSGRA
jgi:hypothetical protein